MYDIPAVNDESTSLRLEVRINAARLGQLLQGIDLDGETHLGRQHLTDVPGDTQLGHTGGFGTTAVYGPVSMWAALLHRDVLA